MVGRGATFWGALLLAGAGVALCAVEVVAVDAWFGKVGRGLQRLATDLWTRDNSEKLDDGLELNPSRFLAITAC